MYQKCQISHVLKLKNDNCVKQCLSFLRSPSCITSIRIENNVSKKDLSSDSLLYILQTQRSSIQLHTYDSLEHYFCPALLPQLIMNLNVYLLDEAHLASLDQSQRPKFIFKWIQKLNKKLDATLKNLSNTNVDQESEWLRIETVNT